MRIRLPFAAAFAFLLLGAGYAGLSSLRVDVYVDDKALHALTFFALTVCFYWILDTGRRRVLQLTILVCTGLLAVGSEFLQDAVPNGRSFDGMDIAANVVGSLLGLALCNWYHRRMLERRRQSRGAYAAMSAGDEGGGDGPDLELGEGAGAQTSGILASEGAVAASTATPTLEEQVDGWDENAEDTWADEDPITGTDTVAVGLSEQIADVKEPKKRVD